jgi:hypothetical protein
MGHQLSLQALRCLPKTLAVRAPMPRLSDLLLRKMYSDVGFSPRFRISLGDEMKRLMLIGTFLLATVAGRALAQEPIVASVSYRLSQSEIDALSESANGGSGDAARKLTDHYYFLVPTRKNRKKALEWSLIGSENGDPESQYRAYQILSMSPKTAAQLRALFWLKVATQGGNEGARAQLRQCSTIQSRRPSGTPCFGPRSGG